MSIVDWSFRKIGTMHLCILIFILILESNEGETEIAIIPEGFDDVAMKINCYALQRQMQDKIGYVVCHKEEVLNSLVER